MLSYLQHCVRVLKIMVFINNEYEWNQARKMAPRICDVEWEQALAKAHVGCLYLKYPIVKDLKETTLEVLIKVAPFFREHVTSDPRYADIVGLFDEDKCSPGTRYLLRAYGWLN